MGSFFLLCISCNCTNSCVQEKISDCPKSLSCPLYPPAPGLHNGIHVMCLAHTLAIWLMLLYFHFWPLTFFSRFFFDAIASQHFFLIQNMSQGQKKGMHLQWWWWCPLNSLIIEAFTHCPSLTITSIMDLYTPSLFLWNDWPSSELLSEGIW